jgi:CheY-like chemotaxis protein
MQSGLDEHAARLQGARLLLVEDNDINQQIACELLEGAGATVTVANNGREAVEVLHTLHPTTPFDIVLMDLQMPEMDGYQATAKIRSESRLSDLPIIAMTAHATVEERERCLAAGMNDHIAKPIDPAAMFRTLSAFYQTTDVPSASPDATTDVSAGVALPAVDGLDQEDGLRRVGGNQDLYLKLLRQFAKEQAGVPDRIAALMAGGEPATAERLAHSLKGVAGNLGIPTIQDAAAGLERAIRDKAPDDQIESLRLRLDQVLDRFLTGLLAALPAEHSEQAASPHPVSQTPVDTGQLADLTRMLRQLLCDSDPSAATVLEANAAALRTLFAPDQWTAFTGTVEGYDFTGALALLDQVAPSD